jgi:hypothetical protein
MAQIKAGDTVLDCWCAAGPAAPDLDPEAAWRHLNRVTAEEHDWKPVLALTGTPDI